MFVKRKYTFDLSLFRYFEERKNFRFGSFFMISERSEYSCIGSGHFIVFFSWKLVHAQFWFFAVWHLISFELQFISFVKRKENSTMEQRKCKGHEKRDRLLVTKVVFNFQISLRNWKLIYWSSFSNWVTFIKRVAKKSYHCDLFLVAAIYEVIQ